MHWLGTHTQLHWDITLLCSAGVLSVLQVWCSKVLCDLKHEMKDWGKPLYFRKYLFGYLW